MSRQLIEIAQDNRDPDRKKLAEQYLNGFKELDGDALVGIYNYADIDDTFLIPIHHWLKWFKFGFTRSWDNLSIEIRNGRIKRDEALEVLRKNGAGKPSKAIDDFCNWSNISKREFNQVLEKFRNRDIWDNANGFWQIKNFILNKA